MDPFANLKEQLELARDITAAWDDFTMEQRDRVVTQAERLSELVLALDEWMRKGGFSPWL